MLVIRGEQMETLKRYMNDRFENEMVEHLQERFEDFRRLKDQVCRDFVRAGCEQARSYGIKKEYDLRRYLEHMAVQGLGFDKQPWASQILTDKSLSAKSKMERIDNHVIFAKGDAQP